MNVIETGSTVSKNTDYIVYGKNAGSKLDKARSLGTQLLTEQQFINMARGYVMLNDRTKNVSYCDGSMSTT